MKGSCLIFLLLAIFACARLPAQTFSLITGREPVASLDGLWRFHTGDNPAWAGPNFDDSQWALLRAGEGWATQGYSGYGGYGWYRCRLQISDGSRPPDLLLMAIFTGYQLYANGKLIGGEGSIVPTRNEVVAAFPAVYRLPQGSPGSLRQRSSHLGNEDRMGHFGSLPGNNSCPRPRELREPGATV
ncbi:MAG: hypothetical protein ACRD3N_18080 [Terracidiphilus sp.]